MQSNQLPFIAVFIAATLRIGTPLILTSLGGVVNEKSGVTNIGLDGIMIMGAFFAVVGTQYSGSPLIGIASGLIGGLITSLIFGFLSITLKADQIIAGTAINTLAMALPSLLLWMLFKRQGQSDGVKQIAYSEGVRNFFSKIPGGQFFLELNYFVFLAFFLTFLLWFMINKTRWGLRLRAVGEHPRAADTLGINVIRSRYVAVAISGLLASLGGISLSIVSNNLYRDGMVNGRGFIALAAMIFGNWSPVGAMLASLLFGASEVLQIKSQALGLKIPMEVYYILPYLLTMIAISVSGRKSQAPAALGKPYEKGER